MKPTTSKIWFPAKSHGWGWGPPTCWEGWAVVVFFYILLVCSALFFLPRHPAVFVLSCIVLGLVLVAVG